LNGEFDPLHGEIIATALREADTRTGTGLWLSVRVRRGGDLPQFLDRHPVKAGRGTGRI